MSNKNTEHAAVQIELPKTNQLYLDKPSKATNVPLAIYSYSGIKKVF